MSLEGRRIVVVGASGAGTGTETALAASAAGADVVILARSEDGLAAVQERLGRPAEQHVLDMLDPDAVERCFAALGGIDHVAITADPGRVGPFLEQSVEEAHTSSRSGCGAAADRSSGASSTSRAARRRGCGRVAHWCSAPAWPPSPLPGPGPSSPR